MSKINDLKVKLAMATRMLFCAELVDYSGHISARVPGSDQFLIIPHPVSRAAVMPEDILTADLEGNRVEGKWNLPSELPMHTRTYRMREDVQCVAHLHNRMVVILSMADKPLIAASNPGAFFGPGAVPVHMDPALIHTSEQGDQVARALGKGEAAILRGHGSIVATGSVEWTFAACVDLEESASRLYCAYQLGPVRFYTDDEVARVGAQRRKLSVVQKIWDHYVAKTRLAGLMEGL
ncbi:MAG: class II aldolase/adducin family protein [Deltaproteobacteria bacterium]|nr:class II aldolase/adducin family protein [Deltaproteobacteria bacterium]